MLQNSVDDVTQKCVKDLLEKSSQYRTGGRTAMQQRTRWWKARLKKVRQEVHPGTGAIRYVLHEDLEFELRHTCRWQELPTKTNERWAQCFSLDLFEVDDEVMTQGDLISKWIRKDRYTMQDCLTYFRRCKFPKTGTSRRDDGWRTASLEAFRDQVAARHKQ